MYIQYHIYIWNNYYNVRDAVIGFVANLNLKNEIKVDAKLGQANNHPTGIDQKNHSFLTFKNHLLHIAYSLCIVCITHIVKIEHVVYMLYVAIWKHCLHRKYCVHCMHCVPVYMYSSIANCFAVHTYGTCTKYVRHCTHRHLRHLD